MKFSIDKKNNVAYLYLNEKKRKEIVDTIFFEENELSFDITKDGIVVGIEFLNAKEQLKNLFKTKTNSFEVSIVETTRVLQTA